MHVSTSTRTVLHASAIPAAGAWIVRPSGSTVRAQETAPLRGLFGCNFRILLSSRLKLRASDSVGLGLRMQL